MSQCQQSTEGFIKGLFAPHVAVLCSQDAEIISQRNNLSFADLIRPFCTINSEIQVHDPNNQPTIIRDLRLNICDLRESYPDEIAVKQLLNSIVLEKSSSIDSLPLMTVKNDKYLVSVNTSCPWFDAYRETITSLAPAKLHEFLKHIVACMLVVSSSHPDPLEEFAKLSQQQNTIQHQSQTGAFRWMTPNTLKFYVLLHDNNQADLAKSQKVMNDLQAMYRSHACHLLCINSRSSSDDQNLPDPWSRFLNLKTSSMEKNGLNMNVENNSTFVTDQKWMTDLKQSVNSGEKGYGKCLTLTDHENLKKFIQDFAQLGLIPHLEKTIRSCSEQIASRKTIPKSIFRATRSLFGGNKAASAPALKTLPGGVESQELQSRKLADLYFLCQMYEHAFNYYHSARKDFSNEQTWLHAAGASEMAAFSNFMQVRSQRTYPAHYVDSALDTYLQTSSDNYLSLRCALISLECLSQKGLYNEATLQLLKLSSDEDDLRSAMLLEQIAHCFLRTKRPLLRKFAFYMVLSGHRYGKAMQKSCALLCYQSAFQVLQGCGWGLAEDHINFTIGRHSFNLKQLKYAAESFRCLLVDSKQTAGQQANFMHEFLSVSKRLSDTESIEHKLSIPEICLPDCKVNNAADSAFDDSNGFSFLKESLLEVVAKQNPNLPFTALQSKPDCYQGVIGEVLEVNVCFKNDLNIPLTVSDASLIFEQGNLDQIFQDQPRPTQGSIPETSKTNMKFQITASQACVLTIVGVKYRLSIAKLGAYSQQTSISNVELEGKQMFTGPGLQIRINPPMPLLELEIPDFPNTVLCSEICQFNIKLRNTGKTSLHNLKVAFVSSQKCLFTNKECGLDFAKLYFSRLNSAEQDSKPSCQVQDLPNAPCEPEEEKVLTMWIQASAEEQTAEIGLLFYYESSHFVSGNMFYRTLAYSNQIKVSRSLVLESNILWDNSQNGALIAVDVQNKGLDACDIMGLFCESKNWILHPMGDLKIPTVPAKEDCTLCFAVKDRQLQKDKKKETTQQRVVYRDTQHKGTESEKVLMCNVSNGRITTNCADNNDNLVVCLEWQTNDDDQKKFGQHFIFLQELGLMQCPLSKIGLGSDRKATNDNSHSLAAMHQLVQWTLNYTPSLEHDFCKSKICTLPIKFTVQNLYNCKVRVKVDGLDSGHNQTNPNPLFLWTGKALSRFELEPQGSLTIDLNASFILPGVYNLNTLSVWAVPVILEGETPMLPQNCQFNSLVSVRDGGNS